MSRKRYSKRPGPELQVGAGGGLAWNSYLRIDGTTE